MAPIAHVDLVVSDLRGAVAFYRGFLGVLGWTDEHHVTGERGETITYLATGPGAAGSLGLRAAQSGAHRTPYDRYAVGVHHVAFHAEAPDEVDAVAAWLRESGAEIEDGPRAFDYQPGYYAVFFYDPDGIKLEVRSTGA